MRGRRSLLASDRRFVDRRRRRSRQRRSHGLLHWAGVARRRWTTGAWHRFPHDVHGEVRLALPCAGL